MQDSLIVEAMPKKSGAAVTRRRRGEQLENEILETAWIELVAVGYAGLTMESVSARAHTGIAVLYRRWPNKDELVLAAIKHHLIHDPVEFPDTGNLRTDLLQALTDMGQHRVETYSTILTIAFSGFLASAGLTVAQMRVRIMGNEGLARLQGMYESAHKRGELALDRIPKSVLALPFDLVRHDLLMGPKPVASSRIESIVDELFFPLVNALSGSSHESRPTSTRGQRSKKR